MLQTVCRDNDSALSLLNGSERDALKNDISQLARGCLSITVHNNLNCNTKYIIHGENKEFGCKLPSHEFLSFHLCRLVEKLGDYRAEGDFTSITWIGGRKPGQEHYSQTYIFGSNEQ